VPDVPPLVVEATKKSGLLWVAVGDARPVAVWHLWKDDRAYVVVGPGEQDVPGLAGASAATVTVRSSDKGGRIVTWRASVTRVAPGGEEWAEVLPQLLAGRLNLADAATAGERWAATAAVLRLEPTGELEPMPDDSGAAPTPPSPARTLTTIPRTVGRATRRRPPS
jgi:hypothetical protein